MNGVGGRGGSGSSLMAESSSAFSYFCFLFHWDLYVHLHNFVFLERIELVVGSGWGL